MKKKNSISSVMQIGGMTTNYLNNPGFEESNDDARPSQWICTGDVSVMTANLNAFNDSYLEVCILSIPLKRQKRHRPLSYLPVHIPLLHNLLDQVFRIIVGHEWWFIIVPEP